MPKPVYSHTEQEYRAFIDADAWQVSKRNPDNIWREWKGATIVIFQRDGYRWLIIENKDDKEFSPTYYDEIEEAIDSVAYELELIEPE